MKEVIGKLEFIKMKNFHSAKDSVKRTRRQATDWEKIFAKGLLSERYKQHLQLNSKKMNNPV